MDAPLTELAQPSYPKGLGSYTSDRGIGNSQGPSAPNFRSGLASLSSPSEGAQSSKMSKGMLGGLSLAGKLAAQQANINPVIGGLIGPALSAMNGDVAGAGQQAAGTVASYGLQAAGLPGGLVGPAVTGIMGLVGDKTPGQIGENVANSAIGSLVSMALGPLGGLAYSIARMVGLNPAQGFGEMAGMYHDLTPGYGGGFWGDQGIGNGASLSGTPSLSSYGAGSGLTFSGAGVEGNPGRNTYAGGDVGEGVTGGLSFGGANINGGGFPGAGTEGEGPQGGGVGLSVGPGHGVGLGATSSGVGGNGYGSPSSGAGYGAGNTMGGMGNPGDRGGSRASDGGGE